MIVPIGLLLCLGFGSDMMYFLYLIYRWFKQSDNCSTREEQMNNWHEEIKNRELEWHGYQELVQKMRQSESEGERVHAERKKDDHLSMMIASIDYKVFLLAVGLKEETDTIKSCVEKIERDQSLIKRWGVGFTFVFLVMFIALLTLKT